MDNTTKDWFVITLTFPRRTYLDAKDIGGALNRIRIGHSKLNHHASARVSERSLAFKQAAQPSEFFCRPHAKVARLAPKLSVNVSPDATVKLLP